MATRLSYRYRIFLRSLCLVLILAILLGSQAVSAIEPSKSLFYQRSHILFYSDDPVCAPSDGASASSGGDYTEIAKKVLGAAEFDKVMGLVEKYKPVYEEGAKKTNVPWSLIATVHYLETRQGMSNPSNGDGLYQFLDSPAGKYPPGPVSPESFLEQTIDAGKFLKSTSTGKNMTSTQASDADVKQLFFEYNGTADAYKDQAKYLGFSEGYEGSPYVMNYADDKRNPEINKKVGPGGWGQIKIDHGPIEYPANTGFLGGFIIYALISGSTGGSGVCDSGLSGTAGNKIVQVAKEELKNVGGIKEFAPEILKYTDGAQEHWCADFASWVMKTAGYPFTGGVSGGWRLPGVDGIKAYGDSKNLIGDPSKGYIPKPGDLALHIGEHVNIVITVDEANNKFSIIGGNQNDTVSAYDEVLSPHPNLLFFKSSSL